MPRKQYIQSLVGHLSSPVNQEASAYAPSNIALCKYWGKRSGLLNLPFTDSLSISLGSYGAHTTVTSSLEDELWLNHEIVDKESHFYKQVFSFLDPFKTPGHNFLVKTQLNIPAGAGLASSACGFAALTLCLNKLFGWQLDNHQLSLLARLGSGSACRSIWPGFVYWQRGVQVDGLDSYATQLPYQFPQLRIGLIICETSPKLYPSREAMQVTVEHSRLYKSWMTCVEEDLKIMFESLEEGSLIKLFDAAERNARAMHATMLDLPDPIIYSTLETFQIIKTVLNLRKEGLPVYYTQDAGANIKLLFEAHHEPDLLTVFPSMLSVAPFDYISARA